MAEVGTNGKMAENTMDSTNSIRSMELGNIHGLTVENMLDNGLTAKDMGKGK